MTERAVELSEPAVRPAGPESQRVSDEERRAVVDQLRAATGAGRLSLEEFADRVSVVWDARTYGDLAPLTADLPAVAETVAPVVSTSSPRRADRPVKATRRRLVNVFSGARHAGGWSAGERMTVVSVFGHSHVDLTACHFPPGVDLVELRTIGVFAGIELVVPPGAVVDVTGFVLFGGRQLRHDGPVNQAQPALRVNIRSYGTFGGLLVRSPRRVP